MTNAMFSFSESQWEFFDPQYANELKNNYPELWEMGGGSKGDYVHEVLMSIYENGGVAETPEQVEVLELRESWIKRHFEDSTPAGSIAQVKWLAVSYYGEQWQKRTINEQVKMLHQRNDWLQTKGAKLRDPKGGLTAAGRKHFKRTEGANLKPGVKGRADTPEKLRRKGSFLTRFFTNPSGPMKDENGKPTRLALSAAAWGEPVPQDRSDAARLAAKGRRLLQRYENSKKKKKDDFSNIETKGVQYNSELNRLKSYLDSLDDKTFNKMFPGDEQETWNVPTEEKWIFDVATAFLRRSVTNRRKRRRR